MVATERRAAFSRFIFLLLPCISAWPAAAAPIRDLGRTLDNPNVTDQSYEAGFFDLGTYAINHNGAASARPDGSGTAMFQYHGYVEDGFSGDRLKFLADLLGLTDRYSPLILNPQSFDYLLGFSSRGKNLKIQFDREQFLPTDQSGKNYSYWDVRASYIFGYAPAGGGYGTKPPAFAINGILTGGYMLHNDDTPARLDNSGLALFRYRAGLNASFLNGALVLRGDADILTDQNKNRYAPADLDLALGIGTNFDGGEFMIYRKSRQALDEPGYVSYYMFCVRKYFDSRSR
jgi:hypothetical protein